MSETEIPIDENLPEKNDPEKEISTVHSGGDSPKIPEQKAKIEVGAEASPKEVLDAILSASPDQIMPWEPVQLPSLGLYYGGKIPDGKVEIRPMGLHADKILATTRLAQSGFSIDYLFKNCVKFPGNFDPLDLTLGDRVFLLYYLRGITHGNDYEFSITCTNDDCKRMSTHYYDLNRLYNTVVWPSIDTQQEPFPVKLPYFSDITGHDVSVKVRLLRGRDAQHIFQRKKIMDQVSGGPKPARAESEDRDNRQQLQEYKEVSIDKTIEQNLNLVIVEANGETSKGKLQALVSKLHAKDTATIREFLKDNTPGIDTAIILQCPHCQADLRMDLPITESFFRPTQRGGPGEGVGTLDGAIVPA